MYLGKSFRNLILEHVIFPKKLNPGPKEPWLNCNIRSSWVKLKSEPFEQLFLRVLENNIFMQ
jgi:hypothetical protein